MATIAPEASAQSHVIDDDFRRAITYHLLNGIDADYLARNVALESGLPEAVVAAAIAETRASPYFQAAQPLRNRLSKYRWVIENAARLTATDPAALHVPTLERPDPRDFHRDHYVAHRPAIVRGLIDHWPARDRWSLDYVAQRLGDTPVRVQWGRESDADYEINSHSHGTERPFAEIAERLRAGASNDFYVTANNSDANQAAFAPLRDDIGEIPGILAHGAAARGFIWIGPKGTITPWHHDLTNNLLLQIVGRKRVRMVASHDTPRMRNFKHCFSTWGTDDLLPGPAQGDKPPVLEAVIGPGDALFLPVGWWHHVEGLDQTIGMSFTGFAWDNDFYSSYDSYGTF